MQTMDVILAGRDGKVLLSLRCNLLAVHLDDPLQSETDAGQRLLRVVCFVIPLSNAKQA